MHIYTVENSQSASGAPFPSDVLERQWIGFHGTSAAYADDIECDGFSPEKKPISKSDVDFIVELSKKIEDDPAELVNGLYKLRSVSFSCSPRIALTYALPCRSGGNGVGHVMAACSRLLESHGETITVNEAARLSSIVSKIKLIQHSPTIVYVVDLKGLGDAMFQRSTAAIHVYSNVPAYRILAKGIVGAEFNQTGYDPELDRAEIRELYERGGHWICEVPEGCR